MFRFIQLFTEMRVIGKPENSYYLIAFKDKIWIFPDDDLSDEESQAKTIEIQKAVKPFKNEQTYNEYDTFYELGSEMLETRDDVLVAEVNGDEMELSGSFDMNFDPQSSILIKKVFAELNLKTLKINNENEDFYWDFSIEGSIPDYAYHGTYSNYLLDIIRLGIRPNRSESNWLDTGIIHDDKIFFTTKFGTASFHASRAEIDTHGLPVVIRFKIPDKELVIPDFDIDMDSDTTKTKTDGSHYDYLNKFRNSPTSEWSAERSSQEQGIYGYRGPVMPKFIQEVYILTEDPEDPSINMDDYIRFDVNYIKKRIKEYGDVIEHYKDLYGNLWIVEFLMADEWNLDQYYREEDDEVE